MSAPALNLGPILFNWPAEQKRDFYYRMADEAALDTVYLGEVVCSKRESFFEPLLGAVIERLEAAGKQVVISTLALIMSPREMESLRALAADEERLIEANDLWGTALLAGRRHCIGPFVNVYNEGTVDYLARQGAERICLPHELPGASIAALAGRGVALEVAVFGRLPLAISARCYHARVHGLHKDGCQYVCEDDPDGMTVETLDGEAFLAVNGTQTLSCRYGSLLGELSELRHAGVEHFRLSPHMTDMVAVANLFRAVLNGQREAEGAQHELEALLDTPLSNGFYYGDEGWRYRDGEPRSVA
jgi:collagenase-like PrtC family protease